MIIDEIILRDYIHRLKDEGEGHSTFPIVLVLGSTSSCLGKSPNMGKVLSCYSLWRSGANPVTSV